MLYLTLLGKTMWQNNDNEKHMYTTSRTHEIMKSRNLTRDTLAMVTMTTVTPFRRCRRSAAPREHYDPPTCARIAVPNGHHHWPSKDAIQAQIEGIYAGLPLNKYHAPLITPLHKKI